jgi:hypothetical protein
MVSLHSISVLLVVLSAAWTWAFDSSEIRLLENQYEKRSPRFSLYDFPMDDEMATEQKRSSYASPLIRFGKRASGSSQWTRDVRNVSPYPHLTNHLDAFFQAMMGSPLIRFGKRSMAMPIIRFGKRPSAAPLIRFGKRAPYSAPHIRFGKRSDDGNAVVYRSSPSLFDLTPTAHL